MRIQANGEQASTKVDFLFISKTRYQHSRTSNHQKRSLLCVLKALSFSKAVEEMLRRAELKSEVRDRKKQELKEEELRQELRECTFTPSIKYNAPKSKVHFPLQLYNTFLVSVFSGQ